MSQQMTEALKSAKTLQAELTQWENRVESAKQTNSNLQRQAEVLQGTIDQKRSDFENYIAGRDKEVRDRLAKLLEDEKTLNIQRDEFKAILMAHDKDKAALAHDKMQLAKEFSVFSGRKQGVNDFIQAVRRAVNVLPE